MTHLAMRGCDETRSRQATSGKQRFFDNMPWMTKNENPPILAIGRSVHEKIARFMVNGVVG